jgi:MFS family permease
MDEGSSSGSGFRSLMARRFPALGHRDFRLLWLGQMVSIAGTQMQNVAINWQIYQRTSSAVVLGLIGLVRVIPIVIFSLVGGVIADTYNRRRIMFITQSVMMVAALGLAFVTWKGIADPVIILSLTALTAAAGAFDGPARQSLIPNLVSPEHLTNAVSLNTLVFQAGMIVGPALSGLVIDSLGVDVVYLFNAATFLAVLAALWGMRYIEVERTSGAKVDVASLLEGLKFVRSNTMIFSTMILDFFATFFSSATALLPIFARDILKVGAKGLGLLYAADSVGSIVAGFGMSLVGDVRKKGRLLLGSVAAYGVATAIYGFSTNFYLSLLLLALVGVGDSISTVLRQTIRSTVTPDYIRGRMTAVNMIFFMGGPQLGNLEAGLLAGAVGAPLSVAIGGFATVVAVGVTAAVYPKLRNYDR